MTLRLGRLPAWAALAGTRPVPAGVAGLLLLALCAPAAAQPVPPQRRDIVGAYYYPWYFPGKWSAHAAQLTPTLGWYKTDSLPVVIQHIDTAAHYGVDVLFMSWWNRKDVTDQHLRNGFLKAPNNHKLKFAMLMEPLGDLDSLDGKRDAVVDFAYPAVLAGWIGMFQYFKDNFFSHPSYFRMAGRPVVLIYVTRTFKNFGPAHIDSLKQRVGDVYIMADEAFLFQQADPETARNGIRNRNVVFESYVSYNSYEAARIVPGDSALSYQRRVAMPYYTAWAQKTLFHPPIMPYYRDFRDGHPPLPGTTGAFREIIREIRALPLLHPASDSVNRIYMVTSWNEWFEGTSIEPSAEHGIRYCQVLREAFVERGLASRRESVQAARESRVRLKSVARNSYACAEPGGIRNVTVRAGCDPAGQAFTLVELGGDEVAFKDLRTGKYLTHHADQMLYPMQGYIGTWEIFRLARSGDKVGFRSKKSGAWLKSGPDAEGNLTLTGAVPDADAQFLLEEVPVAIGRGPEAAGWDFPAEVLAAGGVLRVRTSRKDALRITLADPSGRNRKTWSVAGGGDYMLGRIAGGGMRILSIEGAGGTWKALIAPP